MDLAVPQFQKLWPLASYFLATNVIAGILGHQWRAKRVTISKTRDMWAEKVREILRERVGIEKNITIDPVHRVSANSGKTNKENASFKQVHVNLELIATLQLAIPKPNFDTCATKLLKIFSETFIRNTYFT